MIRNNSFKIKEPHISAALLIRKEIFLTWLKAFSLLV